MADDSLINKAVSLCLRRGFIFPSAEIYGSFGGFFDYGPAGVELKRNVSSAWWRHFVQEREDMLGLDGAVVTHPRIWKASGHLSNFNDPLVECKKCKSRFRADHLIEKELKMSVDGISLAKVDELVKGHKLVCEKCKGELSECKVFNLMFKTFIGATEDTASTAYLRPETAQVIFADFKQLQQIGRKALPFGIAQIGKAFRNEISPRNFVFRCREFEQMEIEFFIHPKKLDDCPYFDGIAKQKALMCTAEHQTAGKEGETVTFGHAIEKGIIKTKWHAYWLAESLRFFNSLGLKKLRLRQHNPTELSHYSQETWDVEYNYPEWGWKELQGIANRTDFDLKQHTKESGKDLAIFDEATKEKVTPFVIEPSFGLDRLVFTLILDAYEEKRETAKGEKESQAGPKPEPKGKGNEKADPATSEKPKTKDAGKGKEMKENAKAPETKGRTEQNAGKPASAQPTEEVKTILHLSSAIAPYRAAVFPLMKKDGLSEKAREIYAELKKAVPSAIYDESGSIGKRYARMDEIGTPFCITIDHQTLEDGTVTVRERDSCSQERIKTGKLAERLTG